MATAPPELGNPADGTPVAQLPTLQLAVLQQAAQGRSTDESAAALDLEPDQVQQALLTSMHQLGARTKLEAILRAVALGFLNLTPQSDDR
jgi:DNA-binding CsgD family transcriptional regulator